MPVGWSEDRRNAFIEYRKDGSNEFFADIAAKNRCNTAYTTVRKGAGDYYHNSMIILDRTGQPAGIYDKNHLALAEMDTNTRCGYKAELITLDIGKVACAICFDLNFEELRLKYIKDQPEIILFSSMCHSGIMQEYWAQTCRSYFVSSISCSRPSSIISPMGEILYHNNEHFTFATGTINLDYAIIHYDNNIEKFPAIKKKYGPDVNIIYPGNLGYFMITSESTDFSARDIMAEFDMITYDEYLEQTLSRRREEEHI